jgi:lipoprotein-releasing system ATP-binding protein
MIHCRNITKSFGKLQILKGIDMDIPERKVVSIVGASGAGKTTLLQILGTLRAPDSGTLSVMGQEVLLLKDADLARFRNRNIGFVFQFHHLLPEFTALENVCMPALIGGASKAQAMSQAKEVLAFLGLEDRWRHKPEDLSGGAQQRVAVARALVNRPGVVFADEPSGNLDYLNKQELHQLFFKLRDTFGQTFVIVTHDQELAGMSDMQFRIRDGIIHST